MKKVKIASSGSKKGLSNLIRRYYYVASNEKIRLNSSGSISRTIKGKWKVYKDIKWYLKGRTYIAYYNSKY